MGGASNAWAVSSSRSATGLPILANDPHLPPSMPPHWYLAHLRAPGWTVAGASFVGVPVFPAGHNDVAAWGVTLGLADNTDLYVEELSSDGGGVRSADGFIECETRTERIRVKGGGDVVETVKVTPRGPIIGPALAGEVGAVSVQAKWLEASPVHGFLTAFKARSFEEFRAAFEQWAFISFNIVYADTSDTVGWLLAGDVPRRRKGSGTIPKPGWDPDAGWEEAPVPFAEMPRLVRPASGYAASANSSPNSQPRRALPWRQLDRWLPPDQGGGGVTGGRGLDRGRRHGSADGPGFSPMARDQGCRALHTGRRRARGPRHRGASGVGRSRCRRLSGRRRVRALRRRDDAQARSG